MGVLRREDDAPSPLEKTNQIERIITSAAFHQQAKPAKLLQFLVQADLTGEEFDEHALGVRLFERRGDWITADDAIVRQNMTRLRKLLNTYYASEGMEDRLNLELPGYSVVFTYSLRNPIERDFRRALRFIASETGSAYPLLDGILKADPYHAEAEAAWAEAALWQHFYGNELTSPKARNTVLTVSDEAVQRSLRIDGECWRAHLVQGALYACRMQWKQAAAAFDRALKSSPIHVRLHPWYAAFLMAVSRTEEALQLVKAKATMPSDSAGPQLIYAAFLYAVRRYAEAEIVLLEALRDYGGLWQANILLVFIFIAKNQPAAPLPKPNMGQHQTLPNGTAVYTAIVCLLELWRTDPSLPKNERPRLIDPDLPPHLIMSSVTNIWLKVKLEAWVSVAETAENPFRDPFPEIAVCPFHLAIGYLAVGEQQKAVEFLGIDLERGHPLMAWLHLWPIFGSVLIRIALSPRRLHQSLPDPL